MTERPPAGASGERAPLLERADELAAVEAAVADAATGAGRCAVVLGPAGIGKTSLLSAGRARAAEAGVAVLAARGGELETAFSFGVVRQLFEPVLAAADDAGRARLLRGAAAPAARLFDAGAAPDGREEDAFALLHGLYWLTLNVAEAGPALIAVDDLQWADGPSLRWLAYLARRLEGTSVGVLATVRPEAEEDLLLAEVLADPATTVIRPGALSVPAAAKLVRARLGDEADAPFVAACHAATGGNPMLLGELLRAFRDEGLPPVAASAPVVERLAPDAVTRSVRLRLARLPEAAGRLARAVAVLGARADRGQAAAVAGLERREVAPAAAALSRAGLLAPEPPYAFVHPLIRNAVYESIPPAERELEHARAAGILAEDGAAPEQVAAQLLLAPPGSVPDAAALLRAEAGRAAAEAGLESAVRYLARALEEPLADEEAGEILLELAAAEARLGAASVEAHLREALRLLRDPGRRAAAARALGHALYWAGREEAGIEVLEAAIAEREAAGLGPDLALEAELLVNALRLPATYEGARRRAAAFDVRPGDGPGARLILSCRAYNIGAGGGDRADAVALARTALAAMPDDERAWSYTAAVYALLHADELDAALAALDEMIATVRRRGAVFQFASLSMTRAIVGYARGALGEAEADGRAALEALPHGDVWFVPHAHSWLAQVLVARGAVDEAAELIARVEAPDDPFSQTPLHRARALVAAARGDQRAALAHALRLGEALTAFGHTNPPASYPAWRSLAALAHHALGESAAARALAEEEAGLARAWGAPRTLGLALRVRGLVEGGAEGLGMLEEAVAVLAPSPARLEHAQALADLGGALRRANRRAEAREPLRQALELAQLAGAAPLAEQAHQELIAAGARPRRLVQRGAAALTPSERRIAGMAAEGLSNREIAQALFVTLRTVEMHLSNAFRKLGIGSRTQLPAALAADAPA